MQSRILTLVVEKALRNEPAKELEIGYLVFENYNPESHKVRVNVGHIREKLSNYYSDEGIDDLVRISLPSGPSYRPIFAYHELADSVHKYTEGRRLMSRGSREALESAYRLMLTKDPLRWDLPIYFPPLRIAIAECRLLRAVMGSIFRFAESADSVGLAAADVIEQMLMLAEEEGTVAYASLIKGAAHLLRNEFEDAKCCFEVADELDHDQTSNSAWYAVYKFLVVGEREEAHRIIESKISKDPSNVGVRLVGSLLLYADQKYPESSLMAIGVSLLGAEPGSEQLLRVLSGLDHLWESMRLEGFDGMIGDPQWISMEWIKAARISPKEWVESGCKGEAGPRFVGLSILIFTAARGVRAVYGEAVSQIRKWEHAKYLDYVMAYAALGEIAKALVWYRSACRRGAFLCPWLDLLPCFAPLACRPRFNEIRQSFRPEIDRSRRS